MEETFYVCLNNDCPKHRGVFVEGDPEHANCSRERLYLEGQRPSPPAWLAVAVPLAGLFAMAGIALYLQSRKRGDD